MPPNYTLQTSFSLLALGTAFAIGHLTAKKSYQDSSYSTPPSFPDISSDSSEKIVSLNVAPSSNVNPFEDFHFIPQYSTKAGILSAIATHPDSIMRSKALLALIETLDRSDFPTVVQQLEESGLQDLRTAEYSMLLSAWAQVAPDEAMAHASNKFDGTFAKNTILETWATTDPNAALNWANENFTSPNAHEPNPWVSSVLRGAIATDLELATSIFESIPRDTNERAEALSAILSNLHATDSQLALDWAFAMEDSEDRSEALSVIAKNMALTDPVAAADWASILEDPAALSGAAEYIAHDRFYEDPEMTKTWITSLPEWAVGQAANAVAKITTKNDPLETAQWMSDLLTTNPDGNYDSAVKTLVDDATMIAPQISAEWIPLLSSERDQERLYHKVLSYWASEDANTAQTWVEYNYKDLPESVLLRYFPDLVPEFGASNSDQGSY